MTGSTAINGRQSRRRVSRYNFGSNRGRAGEGSAALTEETLSANASGGCDLSLIGENGRDGAAVAYNCTYILRARPLSATAAPASHRATSH